MLFPFVFSIYGCNDGGWVMVCAATIVYVKQTDLNGFIQTSQEPDAPPRARILFFWKQIMFKENTMWWKWKQKLHKIKIKNWRNIWEHRAWLVKRDALLVIHFVLFYSIKFHLCFIACALACKREIETKKKERKKWRQKNVHGLMLEISRSFSFFLSLSLSFTLSFFFSLLLSRSFTSWSIQHDEMTTLIENIKYFVKNLQRTTWNGVAHRVDIEI